MFGKFRTFLSEVSKEMKKVSWPTKEQLRESTVVVIVATLLLTLFTFLVDKVMTLIMGAVF